MRWMDMQAPMTPSDPVEPFSDADTGSIVLSPEFLDALRRIAPRRRPATLAYILALGVIGVAVALGADRSVREVVSLPLRRWLPSAPVTIASMAPVVAARL